MGILKSGDLARNETRRVAEQEGRVHQPVRVVEDEHDRAPARHAFPAHNLDAAEEDPQREAEHGGDDSSHSCFRNDRDCRSPALPDFQSN
ncbi:MAG: hypothetical protein LC802_05535 [Acidobacteria bacterium]|nr:hypothetical protein [Acidobacteriota bacterium]